VLKITPVATSTTVSLQLSATVTGASGTPSGAVTFSNGTKTLGTVMLSGGVATLPTALSSNYSFTAYYSGNGVFQPSTANVTEAPDFAVLLPPSNLSVAQGSQAVATFGIVSVANYSGSLTATCSNLPPNSLCRFAPVPVMVAPGVNGNLGVQVFVGIDAQVGSIGVSLGRSVTGLLSVPFGAGSLLSLLRRRRRLLTTGILSMVFLCALVTGLAGCGQNNAASSQNQTYVTPVGVYPVAVNFTDSNGITHSATLNVQVNTQ
jgi:hypothetical protein